MSSVACSMSTNSETICMTWSKVRVVLVLIFRYSCHVKDQGHEAWTPNHSSSCHQAGVYNLCWKRCNRKTYYSYFFAEPCLPLQRQHRCHRRHHTLLATKRQLARHASWDSGAPWSPNLASKKGLNQWRKSLGRHVLLFVCFLKVRPWEGPEARCKDKGDKGAK